MKKTKLIQASKDCYIPHSQGKFNLKKGDIVKLKVMEVKKK